MKAAAVAAEAGHSVTLFERAKRLGGKTHLAQLLPHRAEFGGIITNLKREMELAKVQVALGTEVTLRSSHARRPMRSSSRPAPGRLCRPWKATRPSRLSRAMRS